MPRDTNASPLAERYFLQVVDYSGAPMAIHELTPSEYELTSGFAAPFVDPASPAFNPATDPGSPSFDEARANAAQALFERLLGGEEAGLPLTREELRQAKGVITFNAG